MVCNGVKPAEQFTIKMVNSVQYHGCLYGVSHGSLIWWFLKIGEPPENGWLYDLRNPHITGILGPQVGGLGNLAVNNG